GVQTCALPIFGREDRDHRPEGFLPGDQRVLGDPVDDGELVVEVGGKASRPAPADENFGAFGGRVLEVAIHLVGGGTVVDGAHVGALVEGVAQADGFGGLEGGGHEVVVDLVEDDDPFGGTADLPGVVVGAVHGRLGGGGDVGVTRYHQGPVPRHLHDRALEAHLG